MVENNCHVYIAGLCIFDNSPLDVYIYTVTGHSILPYLGYEIHIFRDTHIFYSSQNGTVPPQLMLFSQLSTCIN